MSTDERHLLSSQVFAYLRGELDEADRRRFEGLLLSDERVSHFVSQVSDMLGAARSLEPSTWTDTSPDEIFESVESRLAQEGPQGSAASGQALAGSAAVGRATQVWTADSLPGSDTSVAEAPQATAKPAGQGVRSAEDALFASILTRVATTDAYAATQPLDRSLPAATTVGGDTMMAERPVGGDTMMADLSALGAADETLNGALAGALDGGSTHTLLFGSTRDLVGPLERESAAAAAAGADDSTELESPDAVAWRWRLGLAALAAVMLAGVLALVWNAQRQPVGAGERPVQMVAGADAGNSVEEPDVAPVPPELTVEQALASAVAQPTGRDSVRVFASDGAVWRMGSDDEGTLVELSLGALAVEFLPVAGEPPLRVRTPEYEVRVVGTVFYASTGLQGPEVGVATGAVEVVVDGASAGRFTNGEFYDRQTGDRGTDLELDWLEGRVNVADHEAALLELAASASASASASVGGARRERERARATSLPERVRRDQGTEPTVELQPAAADAGGEPSAPVDHRAQARAMAAAGDWRGAAGAWERVLSEGSASSAEEATIRLDLARIYLRRLDSPLQATGHLRSFVQRFPGDAATPSALQELCRIATERGWVEPLCD